MPYLDVGSSRWRSMLRRSGASMWSPSQPRAAV